MERRRGVRGGPVPPYDVQLSQREPGWEVRRLQTADGTPVGEMVVLYTAEEVRAMVLMRQVPTKKHWDDLDTWVLAQLDCATRSFVVDYYEAGYVTGVEGPPEGEPEESDADDDESA